MNVLNVTGHQANKVSPIADALNVLLADMQIFYTNLRGFHWNVRGMMFYRLHELFETLYTEYADTIDEVAERVLQLGGHAVHKFSDYLKMSHLKELDSKIDGMKMVEHCAESLGQLIASERQLIAQADEAGDSATVDLLSGLIDGQEKAAWMLTALLSK